MRKNIAILLAIAIMIVIGLLSYSQGNNPQTSGTSQAFMAYWG